MKKLLAATGALLLSVGVAAPAYAHATRVWPSSGELQVTNGGKVLGEGDGSWTIGDTSNGTRSQSANFWRAVSTDPSNASRDRGAFVEMQTWTDAGSCLSPQFTTCTADYFFYDSDSSARTTSTAWSFGNLSTGVNPSAEFARGHLRIGKDINNRTDPHSGWIITLGDKY